MSERKVLNKYYPPDFDPAKIPRSKCSKNRQFTVRLMAPCNMKCKTCGEYIAKAKKFNARKEDVENKDYLGIRIYRFYIKCPGCLAEISFRTDPETTDYIIEAGAHRNFQALKLAEEQAEREDREAKEEIASNPMLLLENRTEQSQHEMEIIESLEDLRELNERHARIDLESMTKKFEEDRNVTKELQDEVEQLAAMKAMGYEVIEGKLIKRLIADQNTEFPVTKKYKTEDIKPSATDLLIMKNPSKVSLRAKMSGLIKISTATKIKLEEPDTHENVSSKPFVQNPSINNYIISSSTNENSTKSALSLLGSYSDSSDSEGVS